MLKVFSDNTSFIIFFLNCTCDEEVFSDKKKFLPNEFLKKSSLNSLLDVEIQRLSNRYNWLLK